MGSISSNLSQKNAATRGAEPIKQRHFSSKFEERIYIKIALMLRTHIVNIEISDRTTIQ